MDKKLKGIILITIIVISFISYLSLTAPQQCEFLRYEYGTWEKDCGSWGNKDCGEYTCSGDYKERMCYKTKSCEKTREVYKVMRCDGETKREFTRTETEVLQDEQKSYVESEYNQFCHYLSERPDSYLSCEGHVDCNSQNVEQLAERLMEKCESQAKTQSMLALGLIPDDCTPKDLIKKDVNWVYSNIEYNDKYLEEGWFADASEILEEKEGICSHKSILLAAIAREQGIPTKVIEGCAVPECEWWQVWCSIPRVLFGEPGHTWNQAWIYSWRYADSTADVYGNKIKDMDYYDSSTCNIHTNDCFYGKRCRK